MNPQTPQPDLQVLNLTKAIRQKESGGNYKAIGDVGTSTGAYQYQAGTWKQYAKEILGDENAEMSEANQNAVTYGKVKKWKEEGLGPAEIAARWNAGNNPNWQNNIGKKEINGQTIEFNTPQYVKDVIDIYKKGSQPTTQKTTFSSAIKDIQEQQPQQIEEPQKKDGIGKTILKSLVKSPLTMLARPIQAGFRLAGTPTEKIDEVTKNIAGDYVAPTPKGGLDVVKDVGRGVETALPALSKLSLAKSGLVAGKGLKNKDVIKILTEGLDPGKDLANLTREQALTRLNAKLNLLKTSQLGGKLEQNIIQAIQELAPQLSQKPGLLKRLISGSGFGALDLVGAGSLVSGATRSIKDALTGQGVFKNK